MKKTLFILFAVALFGGMTSCKKDYTCDCVMTSNGVSYPISVELNNVTHKDAKDACDSKETTTSLGGITSTTTCSLK